jgi:tRNA (cmo5U34)-methyltransferase
MKLEKMDEFFDNRVYGYEQHQLNCIDSAKEFYTVTASQLPPAAGSVILDLGCGTGLELNEYFNINPHAIVTGIDLAGGMLHVLQNKAFGNQVTLINGSYFDVPFGKNIYDAAVSVESLHHFTMKQKIPLYKKLYQSLKKDGYFILTDYVAENDKTECRNFAAFAKLKEEAGITAHTFYHYDTPLTLEHEKEALMAGGFSSVELLHTWQCTASLKACK